MKRRGSFDPSDYGFGDHVRSAGEILRDSREPLTVEELARLIGRASPLQGDARRAAYQIEGLEDDRERGWVLLTEQALKVLKRARLVAETPKGWTWTREGSEPVTATYQGRRVLILSAEERAAENQAEERKLRLTPDPFTAHHLNTDKPLIRENGNLPGRVFDRMHTDTQELRQSLLSFGYIDQLPILVDEKGVTLDGRTREQLCRELREEFPERDDLEPTKRMLTLGDGPEANAQRLKIALAANVGRRNLSTETKREVARYLYDERNWTYEQIAEAFNVSESGARKMAAEGRARRQTQARPRRSVDQPEWRAQVDPLIHDWIEGRTTRDEIHAELKARGMARGTAKSALTERKAQLEAEIERSSPESALGAESGEPSEIEARETPQTSTPERPEEASVAEELSYVIAALEEIGTPGQLVNRLRVILARLDGSIISEP